MTNLKRALGFFLFFTFLLGLVYPLLTILIGRYLCPYQAGGSLLTINGQVVGSSLIAQKFKSDQYFHSRSSATNYNAAASGGGNLDLGDIILYEKTRGKIKEVVEKNGIPLRTKIPADMVFSSASGLDPHISMENVLLQMPRVAKERNLSKKIIRNLINEYFDADFVGIWGVGGVNVLKLNLALDNLGKKAHD